MGIKNRRAWSITVAIAIAVLAVACAGAAPATPVPTTPATTGEATPTSAPVATPGFTPIPTGAPTATPVPAGVASARDTMTLVINQEPLTMNPFPSQGGIAASPGKDNIVDPLTWQSGDDQRIVPTTATTGWEQLAPNKWRFRLRQGVKFHNGEAWNAQAALPSLAYQGVGNNDNSSFAYTGGFKAEATDEYTLDITCDQACPVFPNTTIFLNFLAPDFYANSSEETLTRQAISFGPYKLVEWQPGVALTQEAYEGYVPAGDHFEFQKPLVQNLTWVWRGETTVAAAMVQTGEADIAWDVGVDAIGALPENMIKSGSSAEVFGFWLNTLWHPELKKKEVRRAIAHAINCQEIVDSLYSGLGTCRGNVMWPGVIGATERNTAPYEYNPELSKQLLAEANYDPSNLIKITGRADRIPKQVEVYETIHAYLQEVGMNVEINVVEASVRNELRECAIGKAVNEVLEAQGKDPEVAEPTLQDMQAALAKGGSNCPTAHMLESPLSNEILDFSLTVNRYLNCVRPQSFVCDPSPGGLQEKIAPALAASGEERVRLMQFFGDKVHDEVLILGLFEPPVIYAVNPKLNWKPRFDRRVRVNTMRFNP
jgi:peptide/nickel transport system substrate-binding protein